jgi:hypothetical protein
MSQGESVRCGVSHGHEKNRAKEGNLFARLAIESLQGRQGLSLQQLY